MVLIYTLVILVCEFSLPGFASELVDKHLEVRNSLLYAENKLMLGGDIVLSKDEEVVNKKIMELKNKIIDEGFANPQYFNFSKHFFEYKDEVKDSPLYKILKQMPKGAVLHAHDSGLIDPDFIVNITYWDDLWVCFVDDTVEFQFSRDKPISSCEENWESMEDARYSSDSIEKFDNDLRKHFTIIVDNPHEVYTDINLVWDKFQMFFIVTTPLLSYKPAWEYYLYNSLNEFRKENVMYIEIRTVLSQLYDLDGYIYNAVETANIWKKTVDRFLKDHPDFVGAKLIYSPMRKVNSVTVEEYINTAIQLKEEFPTFIAGFDLVGQEDLGQPLKAFLPQLTKAAEDLTFFFHAGESNWYGTSTDENLLDAIILGSVRLGHAYALGKHPILMDEVKRRDVAIEVNVLSNAVLGLVSDIRNHPVATFLARGLPVVLSSDDPGVWGADPLTHDFFVTFVGVASRHTDLRLLKKLAMNSLRYSTVEDKPAVMKEFEKRWTIFINDMLVNNYDTDETRI